MREFTYTVTDPLGIHARPAGLLAKAAAQFKSTVTLSLGDLEANAKGVIGLMRLCAKQGNTLVFHVEGEDEDLAIAALETFCKANL